MSYKSKYLFPVKYKNIQLSKNTDAKVTFLLITRSCLFCNTLFEHVTTKRHNRSRYLISENLSLETTENLYGKWKKNTSFSLVPWILDFWPFVTTVHRRSYPLCRQNLYRNFPMYSQNYKLLSRRSNSTLNVSKSLVRNWNLKQV